MCWAQLVPYIPTVEADPKKWIGGAVHEIDEPYQRTAVWNDKWTDFAPLLPLGNTSGARMGKLLTYVRSKTWGHPPDLSIVQQMATELRAAAKASEAETDAAFKKFMDAAARFVPAEYVAYAAAGYNAWKAIGGVLFGKPADSDDEIAALGAAIRQCLGEGFPTPWQAFRNIGASARGLTTGINTWIGQCRALSDDKRTALRQWWTAWMFYSKDPAFEQLYGSPLMSMFGNATDGTVILGCAPYCANDDAYLLDIASKVWTTTAPGATGPESLAIVALEAQRMTKNKGWASPSTGKGAEAAALLPSSLKHRAIPPRPTVAQRAVAGGAAFGTASLLIAGVKYGTLAKIPLLGRFFR